MLTPILATDDPYHAAAVFVRAGWSLVFETPADSGDPLTCVGLAGARLMLGTSLPQFLPAGSSAHKGAGVEFHLTVPKMTSALSSRRTAGTQTRSQTLLSSRGASWPSTRSCSDTDS